MSKNTCSTPATEDCAGRTPFFECWRKECAPYPTNSIVYTECGFYMLPCGPEYAPPSEPASKWVPFDMSAFIKVIQQGMYADCSFMFPATKSDEPDLVCAADYKRVWGLGEIRCHNGYFHCSKRPNNASDPAPDGAESADWTKGMTNNQLICKLIEIEDTDTQITLTGISSDGSTITAVLSDGTVITGPDRDVYVTSVDDTGTEIVLTLSNGTTVSDLKIDNDDYLTQDPDLVTNADGSHTVTLTMESGATYTFDIPAPAAAPDPICVSPTGGLELDGNGCLAIKPQEPESPIARAIGFGINADSSNTPASAWGNGVDIPLNTSPRALVAGTMGMENGDLVIGTSGTYHLSLAAEVVPRIDQPEIGGSAHRVTYYQVKPDGTRIKIAHMTSLPHTANEEENEVKFRAWDFDAGDKIHAEWEWHSPEMQLAYVHVLAELAVPASFAGSTPAEGL